MLVKPHKHNISFIFLLHVFLLLLFSLCLPFFFKSIQCFLYQVLQDYFLVKCVYYFPLHHVCVCVFEPVDILYVNYFDRGSMQMHKIFCHIMKL